MGFNPGGIETLIMYTVENVTFKLSDFLIFESVLITYSFLLCSANFAKLALFQVTEQKQIACTLIILNLLVMCTLSTREGLVHPGEVELDSFPVPLPSPQGCAVEAPTAGPDMRSITYQGGFEFD